MSNIPLTDPDPIDSSRVCVILSPPQRLEVLIVVHGSIIRIDQARHGQPLRLGGGGQLLLLLLLLLAVEVLVVLGRELLELDEEVSQMSLERRQVHPQIKAADDLRGIKISTIGARRARVSRQEPRGRGRRTKSTTCWCVRFGKLDLSRFATCSRMNAWFVG